MYRITEIFSLSLHLALVSRTPITIVTHNFLRHLSLNPKYNPSLNFDPEYPISREPRHRKQRVKSICPYIFNRKRTPKSMLEILREVDSKKPNFSKPTDTFHCDTKLAFLRETVLNYTQFGSSVYSCLKDIKKAFDSDNLKILAEKLIDLKIPKIY